MKLTDCCGAYSTYDENGVLYCKACYRPAPAGQGDGSEAEEWDVPVGSCRQTAQKMTRAAWYEYRLVLISERDAGRVVGWTVIPTPDGYVKVICTHRAEGLGCSKQ